MAPLKGMGGKHPTKREIAAMVDILQECRLARPGSQVIFPYTGSARQPLDIKQAGRCPNCSLVGVVSAHMLSSAPLDGHTCVRIPPFQGFPSAA